MESPLAFIFQQLKLRLNALHWSTALLESCGWDEEERNELLNGVASVIVREKTSSPAILTTLRQNLLTIASERQIDILMSLLQAEAALAAEEGLEVENGQLGVFPEKEKD